MAKTIPLYKLAKELGVTSKAIVEKCQAEGLTSVQNHMSTVSVGLAATIREWFSEGEHTTAIEEAEKVDLEKVRVKKTKKKHAEEQPETEASTSAVAVEEMPAAPAEAPTETVPAETALPVEPAASVVAAPETPAEPAAPTEPAVPTEPAAPATAAQAVSEPAAPAPKAETPPTPPPVVEIKPAGPMLEKPAPVKLTGPTVVRVEKPDEDVLRRPFGKKPPKPADKGKLPVAVKPAVAIAPAPPVAEPAKGKKAKGKEKYKEVGDWEEGTGRLRKKDLEERRARLEAADGIGVRHKPARRIEAKKASEVPTPPPTVERPQKVTVTEPITVKDLSAALGVKTSDIITKLLSQKILATANQVLQNDVAEYIALEFGTELVIQRKQTLIEQIEKQFAERPRPNLQKRPPVVTMLGHVDHGKTSLLDRIRKTSVAAGEAGGITQHIGAYQVEIHGKPITFLDTPGHEAFTALRARGANMTDIVVLVVAADDGLMPQSIEAIHHARAANVTILVALNKIDLPGIDVNRIYGQLAEHDLTPTEWGGTTDVVKTSALTGQGIEELLEHIDFIAEVKNFCADPTIPACGWVVEANISPTKGPVATLLLKEGHLDRGDVLLAGGVCGRVRSIMDSHGRSLKTAGPATPVQITGLDGVPQAGDKFYVLDDFNVAKQAAEEVQRLAREQSLAQRSQITLDNLFSHIADGSVKELNLIVKADVQGSVDVLNKYLTELSTDEVRIKIIHSAVGGITEGDVLLAEASKAIIIGFNVVPDERVKRLAESKGVDIRLYNIIYRITEDLKAAMLGMLEPEYEEKTLGRAVVRNTFKISGVGTVAGCYVTSGSIVKNAKIRLIRNNIVIKDSGAIESLKHFKDDVREVRAGLECGIKIAGYDDVKIDDVIEAYEIVEIKRTEL